MIIAFIASILHFIGGHTIGEYHAKKHKHEIINSGKTTNAIRKELGQKPISFVTPHNIELPK